MSASDGDYANSIEVSWSAPNLSSDKWKNYNGVSHYLISWDSVGDSKYDQYAYGTSYSIPVAASNRAVYYEVTVIAVIPGYGESGEVSDSGFAMDAKDLIWEDGGSTYTKPLGDQWYDTMLQKGFRYQFSGLSDTEVSFYPYKTLDEVSLVYDAATSSWFCDENGTGHKFYVKVTTGLATNFEARCNLGFGF